MAQDHRDCDELFSRAENAVSIPDWNGARAAFSAFVDAMNRHLDIEEQVLFPAFEKETGIVSGPTEMMRMEHEQMRALFDEMADALERENSDDYLGEAETLLILMQQHNMKEEQILYSMMDQRLDADVDGWRQRFQDWQAG